MDWFTTSPREVGLIVLSALILYGALVCFTRWMGVRSFSKMSGFDFAGTVAFGSILASVILSRSPPVAQGIAALASLFFIQFAMAWLYQRSDLIRDLTSNSPRLVMVHGKIIPEQLEKARMTEIDLRGKLREANAFRLEDVLAVIAETTGDISVLHSTDKDKTIDPVILDGVQGAEHYLNPAQMRESSRGFARKP